MGRKDPPKAPLKTYSRKNGKPGEAARYAAHAARAKKAADDEKAALEAERAEKRKQAAIAKEATEAAAKKKATFLKKVDKRVVPKDLEARVQAALELRREAEEQDVLITKKELRDLFSVGRRKLQSAIDDEAKGGDGVVDLGRPTRLTDEQAEEIHDILTDRGMVFDAVEKDQGGFGDDFHEVCLSVIKNSMPNNYCDVPPAAPDTLKVWKKQIRAIDRAGCKKNDGRIRALIDLRSGLSFAAALAFIFSFCHYIQFFSSDDVHVMCYAWDSRKHPRVMLTQEVIDYHKEHNLSSGYSRSSAASHKQRVLEFNLTISTNDKLTCTVLKFSDKNFTQEV
jgi:hypothetical protein